MNINSLIYLLAGWDALPKKNTVTIKTTVTVKMDC